MKVSISRACVALACTSGFVRSRLRDARACGSCCSHVVRVRGDEAALRLTALFLWALCCSKGGHELLDGRPDGRGIALEVVAGRS